MHEEGKARWDPENDPEYSQRLLPYLARRYYLWLIIGALVGGIGFATAALFQPASYSTYSTLKITKSSGPTSLFAGVPQLLSGKANTALLDEMQIITSRDLGLPIIAETNLQADIYDPGAPDGPLGRFRQLVTPGLVAKARIDRYNRFTVSDVKVIEDLPEPAKFWITADGQGNWHTADGKHGANNETYDFGDFSFTPHFGSAHKAGDSYHVEIKSNWQTWKDYRTSLGVHPATEDSNIVTIAFSHRNPYVAKRVVELILERYLQRNLETTYGNFDNMLAFVADEMARSTKRLHEATEELAKYQEDNEVYAPDAQGDAAAKQIADLSTTKTQNLIALKQAQFVLHLLDTRTPEEVYDAIRTPGVASSIEGESEDLAKLVQQLHIERQTKTDAHPDVQALQAQIKTEIAQLRRATQSRVDKMQLSDSQFTHDISGLMADLSKLPAAAGKMALLDAEIKSQIEVEGQLKQQEATTKLSRAGTSSEVKLLDAAAVPYERDSPRLGRSLGFGLIAGLFVMILLALVVDASRRGFRSLRELRMMTGLPVLGVLTGPPVRARWRPAATASPEAGRLATWLLGGRRSLGIVQLGGAHASYDLTWSLAGSRADGAKPAAVIDLDRLGTALRGVWQIADAPGLPELAADPGQFVHAAHKLRDGVVLLPPGNGPLSAEAFAKVWVTLAEKAGTVLCCLPPPAQWQDQAGALPLLDAVVVAVPQGAVDPAAVALAVQQLRDLGAPLLGIVVTNFSPVRDALGNAELGLLAVAPEGAA